MKKVRPSVDKDLRDEIVNYCVGGQSFNLALRYYVKSKTGDEYFAKICKGAINRNEKAIHDLHSQVKQRDRQIIKLKQEIANLHNEKVKLEKWPSDVSQNNASLTDEAIGDRWRSVERARLSLYRGAAIGLFIGLSIGYLFL